MATQLRNSPYLTQLDGEGMREMERQQVEEMKQREKEFQIRRLAGSSTHGSVAMRAMAHSVPVPSGGSSDLLDESYGTAMDDHIEEMAREAEQRRQSNIARLTQSIRGMAPDADTVAGIAHGAASVAQSAGIAALDLAGNVGRYAGRNLVENVRATPGVVSNVAGAVGGVVGGVAQLLSHQRPTMRIQRDSAWIEPDLLTGHPPLPPIDIGARFPDSAFASSSAAAADPAPKAKAKGRPKSTTQPLPPYRDPRQGGTEIDYSTNRTYWRGRPVAYIQDQLNLRNMSVTRPGGQRMNKEEMLRSLFATF